MKYLKRFNEELKPQTYRNAARKLKNIGHNSRAENLNKWADKVSQNNEIEKWKESLSIYSEFGIFKMKVVNPETNESLIGDFTISIFFDSDAFNDTHDDDGGSFIFFINIIPTTRELLDKCIKSMPDAELNGGGFGGIIFGIDYSIINGTVNIDNYALDPYDEYLSGNVYLADRVSANKFKSIFKKILTDGNLQYPSGYTNADTIYEVLERSILIENSFSSEYGFRLEDLANYINGISVNDLYKS